MLRASCFWRSIAPASAGSSAGQFSGAAASSFATRICNNNSWDSLRGAHEVCYYYPRYNIVSHLPDSLPELVTVKKSIFEGDAAGDNLETLRIKVQALLSRANEVFTTAAGGDILSNSGAAPAVRGFAVSVAAAVAATQNPLGRNKYSDYKLCVALAPAIRAIIIDPSIHSKDAQGFDAACICVSSYAKSMTNQLLRNEWHNTQQFAASTGITISPSTSTSTSTSSQGEGVLPGPLEVQTAIEALRVSCMNLARQTSAAEEMKGLEDEDEQENDDDEDPVFKKLRFSDAVSFRSSYNKLTALSALMQVEHNNDCASAIDMLSPLPRLKGSNEIEKRLIETIRCELMCRSYGHGWGKDAVDSEVEAAYHRLQDFFLQYFDPSKPEGAVEMDGHHRILVRDAYSMFLLSMSSMYQELPRMEDSNQSFAVGTRLALSPFLHVPCATKDETQIIRLKNRGTCIPCATVRARKLATGYADRALRINRKIFPNTRNNARAASALRSLSICFTDVRDYLYAEGMFNSTLRTHEALYGKLSEEYLEVLSLCHHMQQLLKNDKEATATEHLLKQLREEFDEQTKRN